MNSIKNTLTLFFTVIVLFGLCQQTKPLPEKISGQDLIVPGAYKTQEYLPLLTGKKTGIVANHTSLVHNTHLADTLLTLGVNVVKIFGPEHGFRGNQPDGKEISSMTDPKTGIKVISLYGNHKKPSEADLEDIDIMLFDIQDVGARFYTYISTLTYVMEACAENNIPLLVADRPNPNGFYIDGPVLEPAYSSFVGLHSVPIVYGMTIGEYANMVNGEKWLDGEKPCSLTIIKCDNYTHKSRYHLPVKPSPNLPDTTAVYLYPSLCLFEGTVVSIGRGTDTPFKVYGHPGITNGTYSFTPKPIKGVSENPPLSGQLCYGQNLGNASEMIIKERRLKLEWLIGTYNLLNSQTKFFTGYFDKLAGNSKLREQIIAGKSESEIRESWQSNLEVFKKIRKKYLLYPDFE